MNFTVLTIFPEMVAPVLQFGIVGKAVERRQIDIHCMDIRDYAQGRHRVTDDRPYGGGCGMVMKPEPLAGAIEAAKERSPKARKLLLTPQGETLTQKGARRLAAAEGLILVCGRYEGVDERVCLDLIDEEISIGDYVLSGGEMAALVVIDAVTRLIPGVLGGEDSADKDSFEGGLLEHAHYTRPPVFRGMAVPDVLLSGHHQAIDDWRLESSMIRTFLKRPDLLKQKPLSGEEIRILEKWRREIGDIIGS